MLVNPPPNKDSGGPFAFTPDYWYYDVGVNPFGRNGKIFFTKYSQYRGKLIPEQEFIESKNQGKFNHNMCCMVGKLSGHTETLQYARKGLYLNFADFDNELACREFCNYKGRQFTLEQMAQVCFIVQHCDDKTHAHVYWLASKPMAKRRLEIETNKTDKKILEKIRRNELPAVELKGQGDVAFCPGGYHESGNPYLPIGITELCIIEELGEHIQSICRKYKLPVSDSERNKLRRLELAKSHKNKNYFSNVKTLYDYDLNESEEWTDILENSRNNTIFDKARRYYRKNKDILSDESFRKIVHCWNEKYCKPPLDSFEVNGICNSVLNHNGGNV